MCFSKIVEIPSVESKKSGIWKGDDVIKLQIGWEEALREAHKWHECTSCGLDKYGHGILKRDVRVRIKDLYQLIKEHKAIVLDTEEK